MNKNEFIQAIAPTLKSMGFKKRGTYWYRNVNEEIIQSLCVQGSQWSSSDYYVAVGISHFNANVQFTTILDWCLQKRCVSGNKQLNLSPEEVLLDAKLFYDMVHSAAELEDIISSNAVVKIGTYWYLK